MSDVQSECRTLSRESFWPSSAERRGNEGIVSLQLQLPSSSSTHQCAPLCTWCTRSVPLCDILLQQCATMCNVQCVSIVSLQLQLPSSSSARWGAPLRVPMCTIVYSVHPRRVIFFSINVVVHQSAWLCIIVSSLARLCLLASQWEVWDRGLCANTQYTHYAHYVHTQCTHYVHTQCIVCAHYVHTICTHSAHTMCTHSAHKISHCVHTMCT